MCPHTYAYTEDLGKALVELGLNEDTYGQVWHLPVNRAITFKELTGQINELFAKQSTRFHDAQRLAKNLFLSLCRLCEKPWK
jgi:hypothetical protein